MYRFYFTKNSDKAIFNIFTPRNLRKKCILNDIQEDTLRNGREKSKMRKNKLFIDSSYKEENIIRKFIFSQAQMLS